MNWWIVFYAIELAMIVAFSVMWWEAAQRTKRLHRENACAKPSAPPTDPRRRHE